MKYSSNLGVNKTNISLIKIYIVYLYSKMNERVIFNMPVSDNYLLPIKFNNISNSMDSSRY